MPRPACMAGARGHAHSMQRTTAFKNEWLALEARQSAAAATETRHDPAMTCGGWSAHSAQRWRCRHQGRCWRRSYFVLLLLRQGPRAVVECLHVPRQPHARCWEPAAGSSPCLVAIPSGQYVRWWQGGPASVPRTHACRFRRACSSGGPHAKGAGRECWQVCCLPSRHTCCSRSACRSSWMRFSRSRACGRRECRDGRPSAAHAMMVQTPKLRDGASKPPTLGARCPV